MRHFPAEVAITTTTFNHLTNYPYFYNHKPQVKQEETMKQLAIFASGAGSNARKIIEYFSGSEIAKVSLIVCNKPEAGVVNIAHEHAAKIWGKRDVWGPGARSGAELGR